MTKGSGIKKILFPVVFAVLFLTGSGAGAQSYYWIGFKDKKNTPWRLSNPETFLSERAILRREKQNIAIDSLDLPVDPAYIKNVLDLGCSLVHSSRWLNGITVKTVQENIEAELMQLPFVREVELTKKDKKFKSAVNKFLEPISPGKLLEIDTTEYGNSAYQVGQINGQFLHNQGYKGQGMQIAVLDAGFYKVDEYPAFDSLRFDNRILGVKDITGRNEDLFDIHYHGMSVLSIMAGNIPGKLIGTAPKASYLLLRSEDIESEYLIEEDNWVAAAEYADSTGVDIINSSLGYFIFDDSIMNHTYEQMDGRTTRVTRGANIAMSRGILVFSSAGNEGLNEQEWKYIIAPSDGDSVISVGAVNKDGVPAPFTSYGPASDGDIKPNISAVGWNTVIQRHDGRVETGNGTSYSSPVMAGIAACLWQANPQAKAWEVKNAIEKSSHIYNNPDSVVGYGIPDMKMADYILKTNFIDKWDIKTEWTVYPNPVDDYLVLQKLNNILYKKVKISFYATDGRLVFQEVRNDASRIILHSMKLLEPGIYLMQLVADDKVETLKIIKK